MTPRRAASYLAALLLAAPAFARSLPAPVRYDGHKVVRVEITGAADIALMEQISPDMWSHHAGRGPVDYRVPPESMAALDASGLKYEVLIDNVQTRIDQERARLAPEADRGLGFFDNFRTYDEFSAWADSLVALYPDLASRFTVGLSLQGRTIFGVRLRAPGAGEGRPAVLYNGCQHAREWISPMTIAFLADQFASGYGNDEQITAILDEVDVYFVPIVNPDGYVYSWTSERLWRKNRRANAGGSFGVDLNRNWDYAWGGPGSSGTPSNDTYRGPAPFSEPESLALSGFMASIDGLRAHIDFHSYSQLVLAPWGWTEDPAPDAAELNGLAADMADAIFDVHGETYISGPISTTLYIADGSVVDWMYGDQGVFSWTIELRDTGVFGFVLPPDQIIPTGEENLAAVLALSTWATNSISVEPLLAPPAYATPTEPTPVSVSVDTRFGATVDPSSVELLFRIDGAAAFVATPMTDTGSGVFTGALPAAVCGRSFNYYFRASTLDGEAASYPADGAEASLSLVVAQTALALDDDAETSTGWALSAAGDNAASGLWTRADPVGTGAQPEDDHTAAGTQCYVTGNATPGASIGTNDVDGGSTTLTSPVMDASGAGDAILVYHRWYSNNQGGAPNADSMPVRLSNNDGASWTDLEVVTENAGAWVRREVLVSEFLAPTSQMRLRFVARDEGTGSIVEAGVDDVTLYVVTTCVALAGDINGDGAVDFADLNLVLSSYSQTGAPGEIAGDADYDGVVGFADLNFVLSNYGQSR